VTTIYYFTGTGNSLWVARKIAEGLEGARLVPIIALGRETQPAESARIGFVFPVYMWGVPSPVIRLVNTLEWSNGATYVFAVAVNGGQVANALMELKGILGRKGTVLASGFEVTMPSNYIPWGGPCSKEKQELLFTTATEKIERIVRAVQRGQSGPIERGAFLSRTVLTVIHKISSPRIPSLDRNFWVQDTCAGCGLCVKICPAGNIQLSERKPVWNHKCEQCLACIQWCPHQAIQYGKRTVRYERYHHPEVVLKDMLGRTR
jgi:ferredoxin